MQYPFGNSLRRGLSIAMLVIAGALALWLGITVYDIRLASDCIWWLAAHWPFPFSGAPAEIAKAAVATETTVYAGICAFLMWVFGSAGLTTARERSRPADLSSDGKARLVLKSDVLRVGRAVEGSVRLLEAPKPEQVIRLSLSCKRRIISDESTNGRNESAFAADLDVQVAQTAEGWSVPFRFDVPLTAPASENKDTNSNAYNLDPAGEYLWRLAFYRADAWFVQGGGPGFLLNLQPALPEDMQKLEARGTPQQKEFIKAIGGDFLPAHVRAQIIESNLQVDPEMVRKGVKASWTIVKWFLILFIGGPLFLIVVTLLIFGFSMLNAGATT